MTDGASDAGLSTPEAARRLARDGPNRLPPKRRRSALRRFADELVHFFALLLWGAGVLAVVAGLPELGVAVFAVIVVNAAFSFVQEHRADRAAERLQGLLPRAVSVRRDGRRVLVDADAVVIGDLVLLDPGDRIPADGTVEVGHALRIDTSLLDGESEPRSMEVGSLVPGGAFVVEGEAELRVTATGGSTQLAQIARLMQETPSPESPLTRELRLAVKTITRLALGVGGAFLLVWLLLGNGAQDGLVFAIGVTVALVPEALLPTVTLSLAWGAEQLAKRGVLVRELDAVETLGSTTFVCTDKTGTLTRNEMTVVAAWSATAAATVAIPGYDPVAPVSIVPPEGVDAVCDLARSAARCSSGFARYDEGRWIGLGDPMEVAIDVFARRLGVDTDADRRDQRALARFPFDPRRRRMSLVVDGRVIVKGAADAVIPHCRLTPPVAAAAEEALSSFTTSGRRVIAVASRALGELLPRAADDAETELELLGLLAMEDPPRREVADAIVRCRRAGVRIAMVTGDHPATARAIADEVGLRFEDGPVITGAELPADPIELAAVVDVDGLVVARVSPEDKLRIASALRSRGHVVAMTGDGVNDGPALHEADIGVAMGASGTDVAREAADLVLLDDSFASIVAGIEQGRATFVNARRFLTYHLTDNVAELFPFLVWGLSGGSFPLALGVMQIIALDLGTDTASAVSLGAEPPAQHLLEGPPVAGRLFDRAVLRRAFLVLGPTEAGCSMATFVLTLLAGGWTLGDDPSSSLLATSSGAAFMSVVFAQAANAFACRSSTRRPDQLGWTTNRLLPLAVAIGVGVSLAAVLVDPFARALEHAAPTALGWLLALASAGAVLAADALDKARLARRRRDQQHRPA